MAHMADLTPEALRDLTAEQVRRLDQADKALQDELDRRLVSQAEARESIRHELRRFEEDVDRQLTKMNEIRSALDDLGKGMATRRELESSISAVRGERESLVAANDRRIEELRTQLAELRSRMDVGPTELHALVARSEQTSGAQGRSKEIVAYAFAAVTVVISFAAVIATLVTH